jgi:hypothetical protein
MGSFREQAIRNRPTRVIYTRGVDLEQTDMQERFALIGREAWTTVYANWRAKDNHNGGIYCAFAPVEHRTRALTDPGWDLRIGDGSPGFSQSYDGDQVITTYHRRTCEPIEPLVLVHEFHGAVPSTREITEEFRLYHNLYWDEITSQYMQPHDDGTSSVAIKVYDSEIQVRTKLLRQFQAARQLDLLLFIDSVRFGEDGQEVPPVQDWSTDSLRAGRYTNDIVPGPFTRYLGTKVLPPPPIEKSGVWPFEAEDDYFPEFIIGVDEDGDELRHTCNPDALADYFGGNPDAPHYLTPVAFRREVLQKYYEKPELYTVTDGYLSCASLWGIHIDNSAEDAVIVFLGDLGRDLPRQERDYWRSFNIVPDAGMSETGFRRAFLTQFTEPSAGDLRVRSTYARLAKAWEAKHGWDLFRKPQDADAGLLQRLRLPLNDSQAEFEASIRIMAQLMCDAINEAEIGSRLADRIAGEKGISKLERWLRQESYFYVERDIKFLRNLQELRSKVTAHRKGSDHQKTLSKVFGDLRGSAAITALFEGALEMLNGLLAWVGHEETSDDEDS